MDPVNPPPSGTTYDEMRGLPAAAGNSPSDAVLPHYQRYAEWLAATPPERIAQKRNEADLSFHRLGITFAVYSEEAGNERLIPFDLFPRIIPAHEWATLAAGLKQRVRALNLFLSDIYHGQDIIKKGVIPPERILRRKPV